jgi:hypothetical protein
VHPDSASDVEHVGGAAGVVDMSEKKHTEVLAAKPM